MAEINNGGIQFVPQIAVPDEYADVDGGTTGYDGDVFRVDEKCELQLKSSGVTENTKNNTHYTVSSGMVSSYINLSYLDTMYVFAGGTANYVTVNSNAFLYVWGKLNSASINSNGYVTVASGAVVTGTGVSGGNLTVSSGGRAENTRVFSDGNVTVYSGGAVSRVSVSSGGKLTVYSGGTAGIYETGGYVDVKSGANVTFSHSIIGGFTLNDLMTVHNNTVADNISVSSNGIIYVYQGGVVNNITLHTGGRLEISGGTATGITVNNNALVYVSGGGVINNAVINSGGLLSVAKDGVANSTTVNSSGHMIVASGGTSLKIIRENGGFVSVVDGAVVTFERNVISGMVLSGSMTVHQNTVANDTVISSGGAMYVSSGGVASGTVVNSRGSMYISSGGTAYHTKENGGFVSVADGAEVYFAGNTISGRTLEYHDSMTVHRNTVASNINVASGGAMYIYSGGIHRGKLNIFSGGIVSAYSGGVINFNVSWYDESDWIVNDLSKIYGTPDFTITVSSQLSPGTYKLAQGARYFYGSMSIGIDGRNYGTVSVNGSAVEDDKNTYSLVKSGGDLSLTVSRKPDPKPDLKITGLSADNHNITVIDPVKLTFTVVNDSLAPASASMIKVYDGTVLLSEVRLAAVGAGTSRNCTITVPAGKLSVGSHNIKVVVDAAGTIDEDDENNNQKSCSVSVAGNPDLRMAEYSVSSNNITNKESVKLTFKVFNDGSADAPASAIKVYDGEVFLREVELGGIAAGAYRNCTITIVSGKLAVGTHKVNVVLDANATIRESREDNNNSYRTIFVKAAAPDLRMAEYDVSKNSISVRESTKLTFKVFNDGGSTAPASVIKVYDGDKLLREVSLGEIAAGAYRNCTITIPAGKLSLGTHKINVVLDANGTIRELNENNNRSYRTINVIRKADLRVTEYNVSKNNIKTNESTKLTFKVFNDGDKLAPESMIKVYDGDILIREIALGEIAAGAYRNCTITIPAGKLAAGSHRINVVVDAGNTVAESNEDNNRSYRTINVTQAKADLRIAQCTVSRNDITSDEAVKVTFKVYNDGDVTAPASTILIYSGYDLLREVSLDPIAAGASRSCTVTIPAGSLSAGNHEISVYIDAYLHVNELDENNNNASCFVNVKEVLKEMYFDDNIWLYSDVRADNCTVGSNGSMYVASGGVANSTTVNYGGDMYISSGGTATAIKENGGYVDVADGANVTFVSNTIEGLTLSSYNSMTVHQNTVANSATVFGSMGISSGGVANSTTVNYGGRMYISSGGTANSTTVYGVMHIFSGGTANSTTVNSSGYMYISSGGIAIAIRENGGYVDVADGADVTFISNTIEGLTLSSYTSMTVHQNTVANSTTVNSSGYMSISSGGVANYTTVNSSGYMSISSGGTATAIKENGGYVDVADGANVTFVSNTITGLTLYTSMTVHQNTVANSTTVNSGGDMYIFSGGVANSTTVTNDWGYMSIFSGGVANSTTVTNGRMYIYSGGMANSTTVNKWGDMYIYGGVANSTTVNSSGYMSISSGGMANSTTVNSSGYMSISSGGMANSTTVNSSGYMSISSGGMANSTTIRSGYMSISSGGVANSTTVNDWGYMYICSGGVANSTTVNSGGDMSIYAGGTATAIKENGGYVDVADGADVTFVSNTITGLTLSYYTSMTVHQNTVANSTTVNSNGWMSISTGGVANRTTVNDWGYMNISTGGVANSTTVNSGGNMHIFSGGVANSTTVNSSGYMSISSGGTATAIRENGGYVDVADGADVTFVSNTISGLTLSYTHMTVHQNTVANSTTLSGGMMSIFSGGVANNTTVNSNGWMYISSGGTATAIRENGGYVDVANGANVTFVSNTIEGLTLSSYNSMTVHQNTVANNTTVNFCCNMSISSGGVANNTTVNSYGYMYISSGGVHRGTLQINSEAQIYAYSGSAIDFTLTGRSASSGYLINDLSRIFYSPTFTITVSDSQESGTYKLAQGAENFSGSITIGSDGRNYGNLTVNDAALIHESKSYELVCSSGDLHLIISGAVAKNEKSIAKWDVVESDAGGTAADFGGDGLYTDIGEWTLDNQTAIVRSYADILTAQSDENKPSALLA